MIDNISKISLTYELGGEYLLTRGSYTVAELSKEPNELYNCANGDVIKIKSVITKSQTIKEPVFTNPTKHIILGEAFIENAMERPQKPHKNDSIHKWNLYHNWHKMSVKAKLAEAVKQYVKDVNGGKFEWELL